MASYNRRELLRRRLNIRTCVRAVMFLSLGLAPLLSACANQDLAAAPALGAGRVSSSVHAPSTGWVSDTTLFAEPETLPAASRAPDLTVYADWAALYTPVEVTLRRMLRLRRSAIAPAVTCDPRVEQLPRAETSVPALLVGEDPTRCVVNPDSLSGEEPLLQVP